MTFSGAVYYARGHMSVSRAPSLAAAIFDDLDIVIPFRDSRLTKAALNYARSLLEGRNIRVRLIDVHVVPYGVPLDRPTMQPRYLERLLKKLAKESGVIASIEVVYSRDWEQGFRRLLTPGSTVLLPMQRTSWRTSEKRLAARLRKLGQTVIWVE